jgi:hypothetical protein
MRALVVAGLALAVSGCAGFNYVMENYNGTPTQHFTSSAGVPYRIFDKPAESRLMITPSLVASGAYGTAKGLTLGVVTPPTDQYRAAALEFLSSTGRNCVATSVEIVYDPQTEIRYQC